MAVHGNADAAAKARAEDVGFDIVLPRSRLEAEGAGLIAELLA